MSTGLGDLIVPEFDMALRLVHIPDTGCEAYDSIVYIIYVDANV